LDAAEARQIVPAARGKFVGAMFSPVDGQVHPEKASNYVFQLALEAGVEFYFGLKALRIAVEHDRVQAVVTEGPTFLTRRVVVAAGVWTPYICATAGIRVPIMPISMTTGETSSVGETIGPTVRSKYFSAKQRPSGTVVLDAGFSTSVSHGFSFYDSRDIGIWLPRLRAYARSVDPYLDMARIAAEVRGLSRISMKAVGARRAERAPNRSEIEKSVNSMGDVFPCLRGASVDKCWTGVVDMSPDGLPILDGDAGPTGLAFVAGLSGHGFTLGPVIGQILVDMIEARPSEFDLYPFRLSRVREGHMRVPARMM
jgi:glycine/D-amino acid oxidase-like deaminating enzyme